MDTTLLTTLAPAIASFMVGMIITPVITHFLFHFKIWKKQGGKQALGGHEASEFNRLKGEDETKTPRMGGLVIWGSVVIVTLGGFVISELLGETGSSFSFLSRSQTWIPFSALVVGAVIGFLNDFYDVAHGGKGLSLSIRLTLITLLSGGIGWWFYTKLGVTTINLPFGEALTLGWLIIPFYIVLTIALYASGVIDGIDGLSGGVFASVFAAYTGVALLNGQFELASFSAAIVGAILAFLWFNIPPARFWMTETGSMGLTLSLASIVFMTDALGGGNGIILLPLIGLPLLATVTSNVLQISYRQLYRKKLFRIAPLHHHFEAIGWPAYKVTMRYWLISVVCAVIGVIIATLI